MMCESCAVREVEWTVRFPSASQRTDHMYDVCDRCIPLGDDVEVVPVGKPLPFRPVEGLSVDDPIVMAVPPALPRRRMA